MYTFMYGLSPAVTYPFSTVYIAAFLTTAIQVPNDISLYHIIGLGLGTFRVRVRVRVRHI